MPIFQDPVYKYQINRCSAPCVNLVSQEDYDQQLNYSKEFLAGKSLQAIEELVHSMQVELK